MPKDNHSVMQLYLDGFKNNFYTFFYTHEKTNKINNNKILNPLKILKIKIYLKLFMLKKKQQKMFLKEKKFLFVVLKLKKEMKKPLGNCFVFLF